MANEHVGVKRRRTLTPQKRNRSIAYEADRRPDPTPIHKQRKSCTIEKAPRQKEPFRADLILLGILDPRYIGLAWPWIPREQTEDGAALPRRAADIRTISKLSIHQVKQHTNARCIAPRFLERRRPRELVEDRGPVHRWSAKAG